MISQSTKRKRRRNRELLESLTNVKLHLIDKRTDDWLISHPDAQPGRPGWWTYHKEVRGKLNARREHSKTAQALRVPFSRDAIEASKPLPPKRSPAVRYRPWPLERVCANHDLCLHDPFEDMNHQNPAQEATLREPW